MEIGKVRVINIEDEMRGAYLDYAMSVITARALPDVRDGLKPVQRRILYAMDELSLRPPNPYKKGARIVGEVLGKYHPHGDAAVYDTMVRMAQDFSMRYLLVDGQGNFGSVDGDPPAAMRYTEARLTAIAVELLADIDKNTVDFTPNFDESLKEPTVLPAKLPNLLLNGATGIAVGMATNIPPHNLNEVADALVYIISHFGQGLDSGVPFGVLWSRLFSTPIDNASVIDGIKGLNTELRERVKAEAAKAGKRATDEDRAQAMLNVADEMIDIPPDKLMEFVKGPDFPTAGIILGEEGIKNAYTTGHGRITIRAKVHFEDMRGGRQQIVVTQLPFQVNKATLQEKIAELVRDRRIEGISELRDESDRQGMRIVIELKREAQPRQILNQLFKYTAMQSGFSINMLALVDGQPRVLTLKMILLHYLNYRKEVITRRTQFDLDKARHRAHILEGLKIALDNLDEVIATIRKSRDADAAKTALMKNFKLTEIQAQAILDMQLRRLAALERKKILDELAETLKLIAHLEDLLANPGKILYLIRDELNELKTKYGDARRTKIAAEEVTEFTEEDLVADEPILVGISGKSYVKRMPIDGYRMTRRGKGLSAPISREEDPIQLLASASTRAQMLFFSNRGRAFQVKANDLPDAGRQGRGLPVSNFVSLQEGERIVGSISVRSFDETSYVIFVTANGDVKRVALSEYSSSRSTGIIGISIAGGDDLVWAGLSDGNGQVIVVTRQGQAIRFSEGEVRASGRTSGGIRAIRLGKGDIVVDVDICHDEPYLAIVTKNGFAKRSQLDEYPLQGRGGGGVRANNVTDKTGDIVGAKVLAEADEVAIATTQGSLFRAAVDGLPLKGRALQVAPLVPLEKGDSVISLVRVFGKSENGGGKGDGRPSPNGEPGGEPMADLGEPMVTLESSNGKAKTGQNGTGTNKATRSKAMGETAPSSKESKTKESTNAKKAATTSGEATHGRTSVAKISTATSRAPAVKPEAAEPQTSRRIIIETVRPQPEPAKTATTKTAKAASVVSSAKSQQGEEAAAKTATKATGQTKSQTLVGSIASKLGKGSQSTEGGKAGKVSKSSASKLGPNKANAVVGKSAKSGKAKQDKLPL